MTFFTTSFRTILLLTRALSKLNTPVLVILSLMYCGIVWIGNDACIIIVLGVLSALFYWKYSVAEIDHCFSTPCKNEGSCFSVMGGYECKCTLGFTGPICESGKVIFCRLVKINPCQIFTQLMIRWHRIPRHNFRLHSSKVNRHND